MMLEIPVFSGSLEERVALIESFLVLLAETLMSVPCDLAGVERGRKTPEGDEIILIYRDGRRASYLLKPMK